MKQFLTFFLALAMLLGCADSFARGGGGRSFGGGGRSFSSSRSSFGSRSSYSGFRSSPSRSFTFRSSPSTTTRPSTSTFSRPSGSTRKTTIVNNHYGSPAGHSSGGGLGMMDYFMLHSIINHDNNNGPAYVPQPVIVQQPGQPYVGPAQVVEQPSPYQGSTTTYQQPEEESHWFRNLVLIFVGAGILYGLFKVAQHIGRQYGY